MYGAQCAPFFIQMEFQNKVQLYIQEQGLFEKNDRILVACSGGVDSVVLLKTLKDLGYAVSCGHVHHGLRDNADRDLHFTEGFCVENSIPFRATRVDVKARVSETHETVEEAARILRYEALAQMAKDADTSVIALAHHKNDQAETVLFQMLRGSGLKGLSGMAPVRMQKTENGVFKLARPLLSVTREEILHFAESEHLSWVEDETNAINDASRNRIRNKVIPELREIRPDAVEKIAATAEFAGEADRYLRAEADAFIEKHGKKTETVLRIPLNLARDLNPLLLRYVILGILRDLSVSLKDVSRKHIEALNGVFSGVVGTEITLPGGAYGVTEYESAAFSREKQDYLASVSEDFSGYRLKTRLFPMEKGMEFPENIYTKCFDYDKITGTVILRTRQAGDLLSVAPDSRKKLKEYFIDEKIPRLSRDRIPVVADENRILWVFGHRMGAEYRVTEQTKTVLEITIEKDGNDHE